MKSALIEGERICEFVATAADQFPVAPPLHWVEVPDDTTTQDTYVNGAVVKYVPPEKPKIFVDTTDFIARFTNQEYLLLEKFRRDQIAADKVGISKNWDICMAEGTIDVLKQKMQNLKTDLVAAGVITAARGEEIFS